MPMPTLVSARAVAGATSAPVARKTSQAALFMTASSPRPSRDEIATYVPSVAPGKRSLLSTDSASVADCERPSLRTKGPGILPAFRGRTGQSMSEGFYLGKELDPKSGRLGDRVLLDPADLLTHGLVVGMTGSGKTGLAIALLEEALRQKIPVLAV